MLAALIAAMGTSLSEVGAIVIVGGNVYGYDQTLASAALYDANAAHYDQAVATGIVLDRPDPRPDGRPRVSPAAPTGGSACASGRST